MAGPTSSTASPAVKARPAKIVTPTAKTIPPARLKLAAATAPLSRVARSSEAIVVEKSRKKNAPRASSAAAPTAAAVVFGVVGDHLLGGASRSGGSPTTMNDTTISSTDATPLRGRSCLRVHASSSLSVRWSDSAVPPAYMPRCELDQQPHAVAGGVPCRRTRGRRPRRCRRCRGGPRGVSSTNSSRKEAA